METITVSQEEVAPAAQQDGEFDAEDRGMGYQPKADKLEVKSTVALVLAAGQDAHVTSSAVIAGAAGQNMTLKESGAMMLSAGQDLHVTNGGAGIMLAGDNAQIKHGGAAVLAARRNLDVQNTEPQSSLLLVAQDLTTRNGSNGLVIAGNATIDDKARILVELSPRKVVKAAITLAALPFAVVSLLSDRFSNSEPELE